MKYLGIKEVDAVHMTAHEARLEGYKVPEDYAMDEAGREVTYKGRYKSWCPEKPFLDSNRPYETRLHRMVVELQDLTLNLTKLNAFIGTHPYRNLPWDEMYLLRRQSEFMEGYLSILKERVGALELSSVCDKEQV